MSLQLEWDEQRARVNTRKHDVRFVEAATVFGDPLSLTIPDPEHSHDEQRFVTIAMSRRGWLLVVVHVEPGSKLRLISARAATARERKAYEEHE